MDELAGQVAIVTGSARNIGRAIAEVLADAGAAVIVNARSSKTEVEEVAAGIVARGGAPAPSWPTLPIRRQQGSSSRPPRRSSGV